MIVRHAALSLLFGLLLGAVSVAVPPFNAEPATPPAVPPFSQPAVPPGVHSALPIAVPVTDRDRVLAVGDLVTLQILEDREQPISRRVTDSGDLDVPYIGRIRAAGKTTKQVASQIERQLEVDYYHNATVNLGIDQVNRAAAMARIFISGRVQREGPIEFYKGDKLTVSEAILRAGGFHQFADSRNVKVTRQDSRGETSTHQVDVKSVLEKGRLEQDMEVRDGDRIFVPQRLINF
jgi:protein involved in polysaccharide export with SLBB domain